MEVILYPVFAAYSCASIGPILAIRSTVGVQMIDNPLYHWHHLYKFNCKLATVFYCLLYVYIL